MTRADLTTIQIQKSALGPLDDIAKKFGVKRSVVVRWALEHYVSSFVSNGSNDLTIKPIEHTLEPTEFAAAD